jgi:hypothetical protein
MFDNKPDQIVNTLPRHLRRQPQFKVLKAIVRSSPVLVMDILPRP